MHQWDTFPCYQINTFLAEAFKHLRYGGYSLVGRAPGCGPGGRGFKSHYSPHYLVALATFIGVSPSG